MLLFTLIAPDIVQVGSTVELGLIVENPERRTLVIELAVPRQNAFDPMILRADGELVWRSWSGVSGGPAPDPIVLGPGEKLLLSQTWNSCDTEGQLVPPGEYLLRVSFHRSRGGVTVADRRPMRVTP